MWAAWRRRKRQERCGAVYVRIGGEEVRCYMPVGHRGDWHIGAASFTHAYKWPVVQQQNA